MSIFSRIFNKQSHDCAELKDSYIKTIRDRIIESCNKVFTESFCLYAASYKDADACVPGGPLNGWELVEYKIDLKTHKLFIYATLYPFTFGPTPSKYYKISPSEFHSAAKKHNFPAELKNFKTQEDWDLLFNDELILAIENAKIKAEKKEQENNKKMALVIPNEYLNDIPEMNITDLKIEITDELSVGSILLSKEDNKYNLKSLIRGKRDKYPYWNFSKELTSEESVFVEKELVKLINNPDMSPIPIHSLSPFYHEEKTMEIRIKTNNVDIEENGEALNKYQEYYLQLMMLAKFGSKIKDDDYMN